MQFSSKIVQFVCVYIICIDAKIGLILFRISCSVFYEYSQLLSMPDFALKYFTEKLQIYSHPNACISSKTMLY